MKLERALKIANAALERKINWIEVAASGKGYNENPSALDREIKDGYDAFHKIQSLIIYLAEN